MIWLDDPYYYLYFGSAPRPPSYFTLERDEPEVGRVIRFDSLSKVLSAGMRIGFLSAPQAITDAVLLHVRAAIDNLVFDYSVANAMFRCFPYTDHGFESASTDVHAGAVPAPP